MEPSLEIIYQAINQVNEQNDNVDKIEKSPETALLGAGSTVDSLTLVNLVVAIEQLVFDRSSKSITLVDESVFSSPENPLSTVGSLAKYLDKLMA